MIKFHSIVVDATALTSLQIVGWRKSEHAVIAWQTTIPPERYLINE